MSGPVYLSLDLDVLDPAFAPGVAHPEPGPRTRELLTLIRTCRAPWWGPISVEYLPAHDAGDATAWVAAKLWSRNWCPALDGRLTGGRSAPPPFKGVHTNHVIPTHRVARDHLVVPGDGLHRDHAVPQPPWPRGQLGQLDAVGLGKEEYSAIHINFMVLFLLASILHIWLNWAPLLSYPRNAARRLVVVTPEFLAAPGPDHPGLRRHTPGLAALPKPRGVQRHCQKFWIRTYGEPPYGHAELSTLSQFARLPEPGARRRFARLRAGGLHVDDVGQTIDAIARRNAWPPQRVYDVLGRTPQPVPPASPRTICRRPDPEAGWAARRWPTWSATGCSPAAGRPGAAQGPRRRGRRRFDLKEVANELASRPRPAERAAVGARRAARAGHPVWQPNVEKRDGRHRIPLMVLQPVTVPVRMKIESAMRSDLRAPDSIA